MLPGGCKARPLHFPLPLAPTTCLRAGQAYWLPAASIKAGCGCRRRSRLHLPLPPRAVAVAASQANAPKDYVIALRSRLEPAILCELEEQQRQLAAVQLRSRNEDGLENLVAVPTERLPFHRFKRGDTVFLGPSHASRQLSGSSPAGSNNGDGYDSGTTGGLEGTVQALGQGELRIAVSKLVAEALGAAPSGTRWRLDQGVSAVSAQRQQAALARLGKMINPRCKGEAAVQVILLGAPQPERYAELPTTWAGSTDWRLAAGEQLSRLQQEQQLNKSQAQAIAFALTRTFSLWQGPPGTGKTRTLLAFIEIMVRSVQDLGMLRQQQGAILAAADTNAAADNLLEGLLERGIQAVRVGQPAKVRPELRHACLEARVEITAVGQRVSKFRANAALCLQEVAQLRRQYPAEMRQRQSQASEAARNLQRKADDLWRRADTLVAEEAVKLLRTAPVVVSTCNGAGDARLEAQCFRVVVLDEASQATEPSSLVALVKGAECVVMAGDQKQLPPTVISERAKELYQLDVPLFTRLIENGLDSTLLEVQYRMHPALAAFPSKYFYAGKVSSGVTEQDRPVVKGVPWTNADCPVLFINVAKGREQAGNSRFGDNSGASYSNPEEAAMAMKALQRVLENDDTVTSIVLLSPYNGQVRLLNSLLSQTELPEGAAERCQIIVSTVDGFQGRECDLLIFSTVRNNAAGRVGFLADGRRLNVAITRSGRGLIVLGNQETLQHDPAWAAWFAFVAEQRRQRTPPMSQ